MLALMRDSFFLYLNTKAEFCDFDFKKLELEENIKYETVHKS